MANYPRLIIDRTKLRKNTEILTSMADRSGMSVFGVTKASCGDVEVAKAMLDGGVKGLADSRIKNIIGLREAGIDLPIMLLRTPMHSEIPDVVRYADMSLNSELSVIEGLSKEASKIGTSHRIIVMIEMGDLREGESIENARDLIRRIIVMEGIELYGLGMNLACFAGVIPTREKIETFEEFVKEQERDHGIHFQIVTGGNSGNIPMLINDPKKGRIDNLRIGEGILLGLETAYRQTIPETFQDAFKIEAQVIESKIKPSVPYGTITQNAYGETPYFEDKGELRRMIVALGRQDTLLEDLLLVDNDLEMIGGSSDHMVLHDRRSSYAVGDIVSFIPSYGALVAAFTSGYVEKIYI